MFKWAKLALNLPSGQRLIAFSWAGFIFTGLAVALGFFWQTPIPSVHGNWVTVNGYVSSDPELWSEDRSLLKFAVRYRVPEGMRDRAPAYSTKESVHLAELKRGREVLVDIEHANGEVIVQRVRSLQGVLLFDPALREHVRQVENRGVVFACGYFGLLGISCLSVAAVVRLRKAL